LKYWYVLTLMILKRLMLLARHGHFKYGRLWVNEAMAMLIFT